MKYIIELILILTIVAVNTEATEKDYLGNEPKAEELGAPLYPGAVFIRGMPSWDPYFETVLYVTSDPIDTVKNFFAEELPDANLVQYREKNAWIWTFLLNKWIEFPDNPTRDDLVILDSSHNVLIKKFQDDLNQPLIEIFASKPGAEKQFTALKNARTVIRYTFQVVDEDIDFKKIIGTWKNVDRDLKEYYGSVFRFNKDNSYTLTLTEENIAYLVEKFSSLKRFNNIPPEDNRKFLEERNPENGKYSILRNSLTMETDAQVIGEIAKIGLVEVTSVTLIMQLVNTPRLTFVRDFSK
ncbi:MAG: hypothetical protein HOC71_14690 [Candidatus Latescibacteria bacterium]|jgi:hypothetical protein|nr:hypothetical protein [Candidatus Latescibacterota bacterium]